MTRAELKKLAKDHEHFTEAFEVRVEAMLAFQPPEQSFEVRYPKALALALLEWLRISLREDVPRGPCGMRGHSSDCDCDGAGGDR